MEILNNLCIALSTPNETIMNIITVPLGIIEMSLSVFLFTTILNITTSRKKEAIYIILALIVSLFTNYLILSPYNIFINYILLFFIIKIVFKSSNLKTLLALIIPTVTFALTITLISNPFIKIFGIIFDQIQTIPIYKITFSTFIYAIVAIIILIFRIKNRKIIFDNLTKKSKNIFIINILFGILIIFSQSCLIAFYIDTLPIIYSFISFFSLLAYFALSLFSLTKVIKLENTTKDLENAKEYNQTLQIMHDSVRCFKHDFDNIVSSIGGYITTNDMEGLKKYHTGLDIDCKEANISYILNPNIVNNPAVYSLLTNKYKKAEENNIKINLDFALDLTTLHVDIYQFTRILGILLDNAIEASIESNEKLLNIVFRNEEKNNRQLVIVENSYANKDVNVNEIFTKGKTGKEKHTGLGLFEVKKILQKTDNLNLFTTKDDKFFKQQLELYNAKNIFTNK